MSGHEGHEHEDPTIELKVGIFLTCVLITLFILATL